MSRGADWMVCFDYELHEGKRVLAFTFHSDPGHGWIAVPIELAHEMQLRPSRCSYVDEIFYYLEEDNDAARFVDAYIDRFGVKPEFKEQHTNRASFIRSLARAS